MRQYLSPNKKKPGGGSRSPRESDWLTNPDWRSERKSPKVNDQGNIGEDNKPPDPKSVKFVRNNPPTTTDPIAATGSNDDNRQRQDRGTSTDHVEVVTVEGGDPYGNITQRDTANNNNDNNEGPAQVTESFNTTLPSINEEPKNTMDDGVEAKRSVSTSERVTGNRTGTESVEDMSHETQALSELRKNLKQAPSFSGRGTDGVSQSSTANLSNDPVNIDSSRDPVNEDTIPNRDTRTSEIFSAVPSLTTYNT
jgi:hypothetical protein